MSAYELWHVEVEYTAGVWTDVTADVDSMTAPVYATNGTTAEVSGDPGSMTLVLHNVGFKYTPGNALSAFALSTGLGIRFFDQTAAARFYTFTGFVEFPELGSVNLSMNQDQTIQVSAVDQLSLWARSQTFVSTLGAHIIGSARNGALKGYWPLNDSGPSVNLSASVGSKVAVITPVAPSTQPATTQAPEVNFQEGGHTPGDDVETLQFVYGFNGSTPVGSPIINVNYDFAANEQIPIASGQVATVVMWVNMSGPFISGMIDGIGLNIQTIPSFGGWIALLSRVIDAISSHWHLSYYNGTIYSIDAPNGGSNSTSRWFPLALRWGCNPNVLEIWVDDQQTTGTFTEVITSANVFGISPTFYGSQAHLQLYVGSSTDFTFADFTAQRAVGLTGLERQTTGDRIDTLARYAGLPDAELVQVDPGQSIMQRARLAGLTVAQAMYEARDTEQGDLYIDGQGLTTFADRRTLLNI